MRFRSLVCLLLLALPLSGLRGAELLSLDEAIDTALANNLGLITARYAVANEADDVVVEEADFDPSFSASYSRGERQSAASSSSLDSSSAPTSTDRDVSVGLDKPLSTGATVSLDSGMNRGTSNNNAVRNPDYSADIGVSLSQPLLRGAWSRINLAPLARAKANAEQSVFELRSEILDVILETEIAYWNLAFANANRDLIASRIALAENLLAENEERERLGLVTKLDVLQAETELLNQEEASIQADRLIEEAQDELRKVMGASSMLELNPEVLQVHALPSDVPALRPINGVVRAAIDNDMDAKAQELAIEVQRINRMLAEDETRPDLDLIASLDYSGREESGDAAYRGALDRDGYNWDVGLQLSFPWGYHGEKARLRQAERNLEREEVRLIALKEDQALAARNAWRALDAGLKRIEVSRKALSLNEEAFEQERARFGSGLIAYRQVLEAQRDFDNARSSDLSARIDSLRAAVRLSRVDGSLLERNGFSWSRADVLMDEPDVEAHPLLSEEME